MRQKTHKQTQLKIDKNTHTCIHTNKYTHIHTQETCDDCQPCWLGLLTRRQLKKTYKKYYAKNYIIRIPYCRQELTRLQYRRTIMQKYIDLSSAEMINCIWILLLNWHFWDINPPTYYSYLNLNRDYKAREKYYIL